MKKVAGSIPSVALSPDGFLLAASSNVPVGHDAIGSVTLWDLRAPVAASDPDRRRREDSLELTKEYVYFKPSLAFSPDRKVLAAGGLLPALEVWDLTSRGRPLTPFLEDRLAASVRSLGGVRCSYSILTERSETRCDSSKVCFGIPSRGLPGRSYRPNGLFSVRSRTNGARRQRRRCDILSQRAAVSRDWFRWHCASVGLEATEETASHNTSSRKSHIHFEWQRVDYRWIGLQNQHLGSSTKRFTENCTRKPS